MHIFGPASYQSACHLHRTIYPLRYLSVDAPQHRWSVGQTDPSGAYQTLWLYGSQPLGNFPEFGSLKRQGVKIVWSLDDSFHEWPWWRHDVPSKEVVGCVDLMAEIADLIVPSTRPLADEIGKPKRTKVCPNLVDVSAYRTPKPPTDDEVIRILWSGSATHKGDVDLVDDACCRIKEKWGDRVEFHLIGYGPDRLLRDWWGRGANLTEWIPLKWYFDNVAAVKPHIVLGPLNDCHFNHCKSSIRILEGWSLNAAVVASPVGEYRVVEDGVTGLVADSPDEWFDRIDRLISSRDLREHLAQNGYRTAKAEWDWGSAESRKKWQGVIDWVDRNDS